MSETPRGKAAQDLQTAFSHAEKLYDLLGQLTETIEDDLWSLDDIRSVLTTPLAQLAGEFDLFCVQHYLLNNGWKADGKVAHDAETKARIGEYEWFTRGDGQVMLRSIDNDKPLPRDYRQRMVEEIQTIQAVEGHACPRHTIADILGLLKTEDAEK